MLRLNNGRTLYYGKGDVLTYRTYAAPLEVSPIPESAFTGDDNVVFAHNITFAVSSEQLMTSFSEGDNSRIVATDSMKNFILRRAADYEGSTTEGFLAFIGEAFFEKYGHMTAIEIRGDRIPFLSLLVRGPGGLQESELVYRRSHNDHAFAAMTLRRAEEGAEVLDHWSGLSDLQLIKVSGSSFYGFVRDEYTTLPESYDRPLYIFLNIHWRYRDVEDARDSERGGYVPAEQIRDLAQQAFHAYSSPSIQYLITRIGLHMLDRFPQLSELRFESNNRTWETIVDKDAVTSAGVYTEPRPPFGFQGFTMTREDLSDPQFGFDANGLYPVREAKGVAQS
ncbi:factor-independent urate hydroxylase [Paenibacillus sacheonensis]|uniref:Uricase n=1 Tax=Paenibacillus sacheonensis TaxID=742054 RepID=A0A7X4YKU9_9BACL|nr:urate oxidase [Paenibacillus sacheonensis]MBM7563300.1 urate oxidase [Paenibacillus sacheonensis]NBC68142.1 urate oxidase [Paenibacillus sacheonensis]